MGLPRKAGDAAELRKSLKPLLEKRRRARINQSLSQLRALLLPLRGREDSRGSKPEKADILETTVHFLKELPASPGLAARRERPSPLPPPAPGSPCSRPAAPSDSYGEGYRACLARLARVLPARRVLQPALSARLLEHLQRRAAGDPAEGGRAAPSPTAPPAPAPAPSPPAPTQDPRLWRPW
ncbi:transcription factor HES-2 isoform X1 [Perognathus longimembris pacificus]|uniref:transcription factor HES-2 isoform X1 n=1 Tax=Perognathus longimembris pacificus TaxID=214514 RepID=UPI0020189CEF|nr:transcription factor HES-2 isoform X1 [Perognathus longimembris pacificus]